MGLWTNSFAPNSNERRRSSGFDEELKTTIRISGELQRLNTSNPWTFGMFRSRIYKVGPDVAVGKHLQGFLAVHRDLHVDRKRLFSESLGNEEDVGGGIFNEQ